MAGILYATVALANLWDDDELRQGAGRLVARLRANVPADDAFDVLSGAAGCLLVALGALDHLPDRSAGLELASACGDHLVRHAVAAGSGIGWVLGADGSTPLTGFAHGGAGVALALRALADATGEAGYGAAARRAEAWERDNYIPAVGNWRDLRPPSQRSAATAEEEDPCTTAWCHGATGVGLGRALSLGYDGDALLPDVHQAVATALSEGLGRDQSLCHGDGGVLELCRAAGSATGDRALLDTAHRIAAMVAGAVLADGPTCGTALAVEIPGLMAGLAGIGYTLLRAAAPHAVPCVLALRQ